MGLLYWTLAGVNAVVFATAAVVVVWLVFF